MIVDDHPCLIIYFFIFVETRDEKKCFVAEMGKNVDYVQLKKPLAFWGLVEASLTEA